MSANKKKIREKKFSFVTGNMTNAKSIPELFKDYTDARSLDDVFENQTPYSWNP